MMIIIIMIIIIIIVIVIIIIIIIIIIIQSTSPGVQYHCALLRIRTLDLSYNDVFKASIQIK